MANRIGNNNNCWTENGGGLFGFKYKQDQVVFNIIMEQLTKQVSYWGLWD